MAMDFLGVTLAILPITSAATIPMRLGMDVSIWTVVAPASGNDWAIAESDGVMPSEAMDRSVSEKMPAFTFVVFAIMRTPLSGEKRNGQVAQSNVVRTLAIVLFILYFGGFDPETQFRYLRDSCPILIWLDGHEA